MWLYILLSILLFIIFLLIMPINLKVIYKESALISIRYLFFKIQLYPQKAKKSKKSKKNKKESATEVSESLKKSFLIKYAQ